MCENIFKLKKKNASVLQDELFLSETTFEVAIGLGKLSNAQKTIIAYEITKFDESEDEQYKEQYEKIKGLFDYMFLNIKNPEIFNSTGFCNVSSESIYSDKFDSLIAEIKK